MEQLQKIAAWLESFTQFFKEGDQFSMGRLMAFYILYRVIETWCTLSIAKEALQPLDWTQLSLLLTAAGIKLVQKPFEHSNSTLSNH